MTPLSPEISLKDKDLSAIYQIADQVSNIVQSRTKRLVSTELLALIIAAVSGVTAIRVGEHELDVLAPLSAAAFIVALYCTARRARTKPEEDWYQGRAGAESVRTLAWKYSVGSQSFPVQEDVDNENQMTRAFLQRLGDVVTYLKFKNLPQPNSEVRELTEPMRRLRNADFATRRRVYQRDRIESQLKWYSRRCVYHSRAATSWLRLAIISSAFGIVMAVAKLLFINTDLLGVFAAVASASIAWNQLNQHRNQATAYSLTARELNVIYDQISVVPDSEWETFAEHAEDAISREHTMWAARRGYIRPPV